MARSIKSFRLAQGGTTSGGSTGGVQTGGGTPGPSELPNSGETAEDANWSPSVGFNLSDVNYYSHEHPFIDRFKGAGIWITQTNKVWNTQQEVAVDEHGWPTGMPEGVTRLTANVGVDPHSEWPSGRYVVLYEGSGSVSYINGTKLISSNGQGRDTVVISADSGRGFESLFLSITSTNPDDPIRNIHVVREDQLAAFEAGEIFNPEFLEKLQDFRVLRFMDWMNTNGSETKEWSDFTKIDDATWTRVPVEVMVELANRTGIDPWFNIPAKATDAAIRAFAEYVHDHLDPRLEAHVEFSNEVWNWNFKQTHYAREQGVLRWEKDANGNGIIDPSEKVTNPHAQWAGARGAEVADIWKDVYGADADGRLNTIIGVQTGYKGLADYFLNASKYRAETGTRPADHVESLAIAGYFEGGLTNKKNIDIVRQWATEGAAGVDKAFQQLEYGNLLPVEGFSLAELREYYQYYADLAKKYNVDLVMYEGGTHLNATRYPELTEFFTKLQNDPRMGELYAKNMANFQAVGGEAFTQYNDVSPPSKFGDWGALSSIYQDSSARWDALVKFNKDHSGDSIGRDVTAFANGKFIAGSNTAEILKGTLGGDNIAGKGGDDVINGDKGSDTLTGGDGNDTINGGAGIDTINGGAGNDKVTGGEHKDWLTGGAGDDAFIYKTIKDGGDVIVDFSNASGNNDIFQFDSVAFGNLPKGALNAQSFVARADNVAQDANDRFIYNTTDHTLWYDPDGSANGASNAVLIATLANNANLTHLDIIII